MVNETNTQFTAGTIVEFKYGADKGTKAYVWRVERHDVCVEWYSEDDLRSERVQKCDLEIIGFTKYDRKGNEWAGIG